jgi:outer membrane lipoprotein-sorting protein
MSAFSRHPAVRWVVPVAVTAIAVGATSLVTRTTADASPALPDRSAAQLLVDVQTAQEITGSGTIVQKADLGLPALPTGAAGSSDLSSLISGSHTLRVWYGGPTKVRLALMGTLGESDVIRNGKDVWVWSSDEQSASHRILRSDEVAEGKRSVDELSGLNAAALTPRQLADKALAAIDPTTIVKTAGTARVAGRDAYELVLSPKDSAALIGQVRIAVDAGRHVPLRVQVFAKNATAAAVEAGFTQISFNTPADSQFRFTPPPGTKITQAKPAAEQGAKASTDAAVGASEPVVSGTGWTSVLQARLPRSADAKTAGPAGELAGLLESLPRRSGSWGSGRLLQSRLVTVLLTDDGRILAGAVPAEHLYRLAGQSFPTATK